MKKAEYIVVDSGGFIKNVPVHELGHHVITLRNVVEEIRDKSTRQRMQALPYDLKYREPSTAGLKAVTEFAKKTGDYCSLSLVDLMVLAVTYDLEVEKCGDQHLKKEPACKKTIEFYQPSKGISNGDTKIPGFFVPENQIEPTAEEIPTQDVFSSFHFWREPIPDICIDNELEAFSEPQDCENSLMTEERLHELDAFLADRSYLCDFEVSQVDRCMLRLIEPKMISNHPNVKRWYNQVHSYASTQDNKESNLSIGLILSKVSEGFDFSIDEVTEKGEINEVQQQRTSYECQTDSDKENDEEYEHDYESSDDDGWITPANFREKKELMSGTVKDDELVSVACLTTDFAMQNVLKQMGLNILSTSGMLIKETKTWILRCYACFRTTPLLDKKFCPKCGNNTLKRVSVTLNADGSQQIHISTRKSLSARGKKFSLPAPVGGKHGVNPKLVEDQREAQQRISKKAIQRNNPMDPDWIAGSSPFATKDVTSKSAMLGLRGQGKGQAQPSGKYWTLKNPNAGRKATGSKRKK